MFAVGDVFTEATRLDDDRLAGDRVVAELLERSRGRPSAALLGLGIDRERLVEVDVEDLVLAGQRAGVGAALEVGAVATVLRRDLLAVLAGAHDAGQLEQLDRLGQ